MISADDFLQQFFPDSQNLMVHSSTTTSYDSDIMQGKTKAITALSMNPIPNPQLFNMEMSDADDTPPSSDTVRLVAAPSSLTANIRPSFVCVRYDSSVTDKNSQKAEWTRFYNPVNDGDLIVRVSGEKRKCFEFDVHVANNGEPWRFSHVTVQYHGTPLMIKIKNQSKPTVIRATDLGIQIDPSQLLTYALKDRTDDSKSNVLTVFVSPLIRKKKLPHHAQSAFRSIVYNNACYLFRISCHIYCGSKQLALPMWVHYLSCCKRKPKKRSPKQSPQTPPILLQPPARKKSRTETSNALIPNTINRTSPTVSAENPTSWVYYSKCLIMTDFGSSNYRLQWVRKCIRLKEVWNEAKQQPPLVSSVASYVLKTVEMAYKVHEKSDFEANKRELEAMWNNILKQSSLYLASLRSMNFAPRKIFAMEVLESKTIALHLLTLREFDANFSLPRYMLPLKKAINWLLMNPCVPHSSDGSQILNDVNALLDCKVNMIQLGWNDAALFDDKAFFGPLVRALAEQLEGLFFDQQQQPSITSSTLGTKWWMSTEADWIQSECTSRKVLADVKKYVYVDRSEHVGGDTFLQQFIICHLYRLTNILLVDKRLVYRQFSSDTEIGFILQMISYSIQLVKYFRLPGQEDPHRDMDFVNCYLLNRIVVFLCVTPLSLSDNIVAGWLRDLCGSDVHIVDLIDLADHLRKNATKLVGILELKKILSLQHLIRENPNPDSLRDCFTRYKLQNFLLIMSRRICPLHTLYEADLGEIISN